MNSLLYNYFIMKNDNIKLESIGNGVHIYTSLQHPFGTDAILLADFSAPKKSDNAADLGSGCGIIPLLWARYDSPKHICAVEIQPNAAALMEMSVKENSLDDRIDVTQGDLREIEQFLPLSAFSLVSVNPPYKPLNTGLKNADESRVIARHELTCTVDDAVVCAAKLLKFGGRFCMCQRPERLADIICSMRENKIEPKRLRFVSDKAAKKPWLVLIEGKKGAGRGLIMLPELHIRNADGSWSEEMLKIYGDYGDGTK